MTNSHPHFPPSASLRSLIPNAITCLGLACAGYAIFLIMDGFFVLGGALIVVTALMDGIDGELARRLNASSELGVQLDSLADVVCFGVAPAVLMAQYMEGTNVSAPLVWTSAIIFLLCSAIRLARFNATITDDLIKDSTGLPTTIAGGFLALLIYFDYQDGAKLFAAWLIPLTAIILAILMVSKIPFLSKTGRKELMVASLIVMALLGIFVSLPLAGLIFLSFHIGHGLLRATWKWAEKITTA